MSQQPSGRRGVIAEEVAEQIERQILDGTLRPGDRLLPERELADRLQVNRGSVREGLKKLEQLRLVEIQRGSGNRVRELEQANLDLVARLLFQEGRPQLSWIRDLIELRDLLGVALVRLGLERASEQELAELVAALRAAGDSDATEERFIASAVRAQELGVRMTHNRIVVMLWNTLRRSMEPASFAVAEQRIGAARRELQPALRRCAHAVEARDTETAARAVRELLRRAGQQLLQAFEELERTPAEPGG